MALATDDLGRLLLALLALLVFAHVGGTLFARVRQPRVIGEIAGGLLLGPTVLGALAPDFQETLFPDEGPTAAALGALYQLGIVLLMFAAGAELRSTFGRGERRVGAAVAFGGTAIPFAVGIAVFALLDLDGLAGSASDDRALALIFAASVAVTSIPVISRIMLDLGVLDSSFGRIVLTAAVIEDVVIYALVAVAVGLASGSSAEWGLPELMGVDAGTGIGAAYYAIASAVCVVVALLWGPATHRRLAASRWNAPGRANPIAFELAFLLAVTAGCLALGLTTILGGLLAGAAAGGRRDERTIKTLGSIASFSLAFFVPVYFAIVGLRLDLLSSLDLEFFAWFLAFACVLKAASVYVSGRFAGEDHDAATNLAVAMNARGGPGIVLASIALDAAIINDRFYVALVLLAILTSMLAGWWLERVVRAGRPLRGRGEVGEYATPASNVPR